MALKSDELRSRLAGQRWTAQNIVLNAEVSTLPDRLDFLTQSPHLRAVLRSTAAFCGADFGALRVADLGCLEGGFSLAFAQRGAEVLGVEGRAENVDKCLLLRDHFALPNLKFAKADVKDFTRERFGEFDVILAMGILYHLDSPVSWLRQVGEATRSVLFVESH